MAQLLSVNVGLPREIEWKGRTVRTAVWKDAVAQPSVVAQEMLDLATHIVQTKAGHFDPAQFEDRYENALVDLLKKKEAGEKIEPAKEGPAPKVVNLMDALRASIDAEKKKAPAPSTGARRPAKKKASQK
jgi:DNA end-binding protein Ku